MTKGRNLSQLESRPIPKAVPRRTWFRILSGLAMAPWTRSLRGQPILGSTTLQAVEGRLTPNELFFVRSHFPEPNLSLQSWRLRVEGHVARPVEIQMSDLLEAETTRLEAVLECAGFDLGGDNLAASNAEWEGVMMSDLLLRAGVSEGSSRVLLQGADSGSLGPSLPSYPFTRIVPLRKCMAPETLVAFKMNGRFLPSEHGFPARALVPGHYATDSVKWLSRIVILKEEDRPDAFYSSGMDRLYLREVELLREESLRPGCPVFSSSRGSPFRSPKAVGLRAAIRCGDLPGREPARSKESKSVSTEAAPGIRPSSTRNLFPSRGCAGAVHGKLAAAITCSSAGPGTGRGITSLSPETPNAWTATS